MQDVDEGFELPVEGWGVLAFDVVLGAVVELGAADGGGDVGEEVERREDALWGGGGVSVDGRDMCREGGRTANRTKLWAADCSGIAMPSESWKKETELTTPRLMETHRERRDTATTNSHARSRGGPEGGMPIVRDWCAVLVD